MSMSTKGPGRGDTCHLTDFSETWPDWRAYPITERAKTVWQLQFFGGSYTTPLLFSLKFLQILHKIRVTVRSSKTWVIHLIPLRLHISVNMSLVSYMHECHVVWLITCQSMEVNSYPCKMAEQTTVILRLNICSGQVPPKEIAISRFSSTFGLYESWKKKIGTCYFLFAGRAQTQHISHKTLV